jgi:hypothetical protein
MSYSCLCGHVISDHTYPSQNGGDLKWDPEFERASQGSSSALKDFFAAVENGTKEAWLRKFFGWGEQNLEHVTNKPDGTAITNESVVNFYLTADTATIVSDIVSRYENQEGHSVYRCPECERIYIQDKYHSENYDCYEKRPDYDRLACS